MRLLRRAFLAFALLAAPAVAHAQNALPARITILVGFGPGQGNDQPARPDGASAVASRISPDMSFDQSARFLARHLGRLLPGGVMVEARYAPGAAGLLAAATLARAPADGSVLALLSPNVVQASAFGLASRERLIIEDLLRNLHRRVIRKPAFPGSRLVLLGEDLIVMSV